MALFRLAWLRKFVRRHTKEIAYTKAIVWKQRLSIIYAITAWNAFGLVIYMIYSGKADWAKFHGITSEEEAKFTPGQRWTTILGIKDATIYRISGFKVNKYEVHNEFDEDRNLSSSYIQKPEAEQTN